MAFLQISSSRAVQSKSFGEQQSDSEKLYSGRLEPGGLGKVLRVHLIARIDEQPSQRVEMPYSADDDDLWSGSSVPPNLIEHVLLAGAVAACQLCRVVSEDRRIIWRYILSCPLGLRHIHHVVGPAMSVSQAVRDCVLARSAFLAHQTAASRTNDGFQTRSKRPLVLNRERRSFVTQIRDVGGLKPVVYAKNVDHSGTMNFQRDGTYVTSAVRRKALFVSTFDFPTCTCYVPRSCSRA